MPMFFQDLHSDRPVVRGDLRPAAHDRAASAKPSGSLGSPRASNARGPGQPTAAAAGDLERQHPGFDSRSNGSSPSVRARRRYPRPLCTRNRLRLAAMAGAAIAVDVDVRVDPLEIRSTPPRGGLQNGRGAGTRRSRALHGRHAVCTRVRSRDGRGCVSRFRSRDCRRSESGRPTCPLTHHVGPVHRRARRAGFPRQGLSIVVSSSRRIAAPDGVAHQHDLVDQARQ